MFNMYHWMNWQGMYFLEKSLERSLDRFLEMTKFIFFAAQKCMPCAQVTDSRGDSRQSMTV